MKAALRKSLPLAASLVLLAGHAPIQAQTVYRIVGPDGKVTYSDKPPADTSQGKVAGTGTGARNTATSTALPAELRQVVSKYPVTLYTSTPCEPCDSGRALLQKRGIPFNERTVSTAADVELLQKLSGGTNLPLLTVGGQRIKGLSEAEWNGYLDAAGYPSQSALPKGYQNPPPSPAVPLKPKPEEKPAAAQDTPAPAAPASNNRPNPHNPAGIVF
ncbi:MAG: DUF4124 domain-containing protein [Rhodoferax sp.]